MLFWTKEKPIKPGWYFYCLFDGNRYLSASVYHIIKINQYLIIDTGDRQWPLSVESDMCRWAGPIEEPTDQPVANDIALVDERFKEYK